MWTSEDKSVYRKGGQNEEKSYKYTSEHSDDGSSFSRLR